MHKEIHKTLATYRDAQEIHNQKRKEGASEL